VAQHAVASGAEPFDRYGSAYCVDHAMALGICTYGDFCIDPVAPGARLCERHSAPPSVECHSCPPAVVTIYVDESESEEATPAKKTTPPRPEATPPAPKKARSNVARMSSSAPTIEELRQQQVKAASARLRAQLLEPEMPSDDDVKVSGVLSVTCN